MDSDRMIIYLVRHGKDDSNYRGGWSKLGLVNEGVEQAKALAEYVFEHNNELNIGRIYASDLLRAVQTADLISNRLSITTILRPQFREVNNGALSGMPNALANILYSGLYWNTLGWDENYPGGESPHEFFDRISCAWNGLLKSLKNYDQNVILVTHGGVIHIIAALIEGREWSNKISQSGVPYATLIRLKSGYAKTDEIMYRKRRMV